MIRALIISQKQAHHSQANRHSPQDFQKLEDKAFWLDFSRLQLLLKTNSNDPCPEETIILGNRSTISKQSDFVIISIVITNNDTKLLEVHILTCPF